MTRGLRAAALAVLLAGCATPYVQGRAALSEGRYDEAAGHFREVLTADPARTDALTGLGIALYKQGALDPAVDALRRAVRAAIAMDDPGLRLRFTNRGQFGE